MNLIFKEKLTKLFLNYVQAATPEICLKKIKSIMNNLEVIHLKEIGHNIHDEIPEEFENIVFNFLDNG